MLPPSGVMKHRCAGEVGALWGAIFYAAFGGENRTTGHMDKPQWGLRVDGLSGRRFLRGLSLTRLWREGCCRRLILLKAPSYNKTFTTALRARKCVSPLVAGATTLPGGKHVTGFAGRLQLPYESSSFATPASGGTMDA